MEPTLSGCLVSARYKIESPKEPIDIREHLELIIRDILDTHDTIHTFNEAYSGVLIDAVIFPLAADNKVRRLSVLPFTFFTGTNLVRK